MKTNTSRSYAPSALLLSATLSLPLCALLGCADAHLRARHRTRLSELNTQQTQQTQQPHTPLKEPQQALASLERALEGKEPLTRALLIQGVLASHPSLHASRRGWAKALARYPQVTALPDPTLTLESAPFTLASAHPYGQIVRLTQRIFHPKTMNLKGAVSLAQAEARREELVERTISLSALASTLFDECVLVGRLITLNREHAALVEQLHSSAEASYQVGGGAQRASLSAELERAELERERNALIAREGRALAELNGLLNRPASASLPPLSPPVGLPPFLARAKEWRRDLPELRAAEQEVSAQKNALALAERAHLPDLSVGLTYSSMWSQPAHQLMVGASLTLPVQREAKRAKVAEKAAALAQAEARLEALSSNTDVSIQRAWVALREVRQEAQIISEQLLPTARRLAQEAESAYVSARGGLADVLAALRQLKRLERTEAEVQARAWQRYATLQRALGHLTLADKAVREGVRSGGDS